MSAPALHPPASDAAPPQPSLLSRRRARCQDVLKADPLSQCQDTAEGERQPRRGQSAVPRRALGKQCPHRGLGAPGCPPSLLSHSPHSGYSSPPLHRVCCAGKGGFWRGEELDVPRVPGALPADRDPVASAARRGDSAERGTGTGRWGRGTGVALSPRSHPRALPLPQVRNNGHFLVLEQGLLIRQLAREDVGTYECQALERSFSRPLTRYSLRVIRHDPTELPPHRRSKGAELGATHPSPRARMDLQPGSKGFPRALGAPGTSLDAYCNALRLQERQRQRAWHKWQHPSPDSKNGRVRRHPQRP